MNNGDGQNNANFSFTDLSLVGPNSVVTPEKYANDMQHLQRLKSYLASYEEKLNTGYANYRDREERQRLEETVRQGQLAAYVSPSSCLQGNECDRRMSSVVGCLRRETAREGRVQREYYASWACHI